MWIEDLKTYSRIGKVFWPSESAEKDRSVDFALETLTATTLLHLPPEKTLEKASHALLERAKGARLSVSPESQSLYLNQPFFRLTPEVRLILIGLHIGNWSYARIARITQLPAEQVEKLAWHARVEMGVGGPVVYPAGASNADPSCPEYQLETPWTQRFLDEELSGRERVFIQSHLLACPSCAQAVARCRQLYYFVDQSLNGILDKLEGDGGVERMKLFSQALSQSPARQYPSERKFVETLRIFFKHQDVFWLSVGVGVFTAFTLIRVLWRFLAGY